MGTLNPPKFLNRDTPPNIATLIMLSGMAALTMNIFLPSLPGMTAYFKTDYRLVQLSVAAYLGVNAVLQLLMGPISDKIGRRPVILGGLSIFLIATLGCILATNIWVFLFCRMLQACVVVGLVLSRAIVRDMVPQDQAASMIGYVTMGMAVVPMVGPALGGILDAAFGWQASFWALFILGGIVLAMSWADLGETAVRSGRTLAQQFREYPELFRSPRFWGYSLSTTFSSGAFFAYLGGAPFVGVYVFGLSTETFGIMFGAPAAGYLLGNFFSGRFSQRIGVNRMVLWGCTINAVGAGISLTIFGMGQGSALGFFGLMTCTGIGNGMSIPNATAGALSVRPHLAGTASGLSGALMIGGGAALSALAGTLLTPETGAFPLLWIMVITGVLGILSIGIVIWREQRLPS